MAKDRLNQERFESWYEAVGWYSVVKNLLHGDPVITGCVEWGFVVRW